MRSGRLPEVKHNRIEKRGDGGTVCTVGEEEGTHEHGWSRIGGRSDCGATEAAAAQRNREGRGGAVRA